jgi:hypothetical protein
VAVAVLQVSHEHGQQRLALAHPVIHALLAPSLADDGPAQRAVRDRARCHPGRPPLGFLDRPAVQIGVEGAHRAQDVLDLLALFAAVLVGAERLTPALVELGVDAQVRLARREGFDLGPEQSGQRAGQLRDW